MAAKLKDPDYDTAVAWDYLNCWLPAVAAATTTDDLTALFSAYGNVLDV